MPAEPLTVSLWRGKNQQDLLCSGLLLTGRHILTVKHAFETWPDDQPVYVRLIDGVDGDVEARVRQRHRERDAAILELVTAVNLAGGPALDKEGQRSFDGQPATLRVIDPDSRSRSTPSSYGIANFDHSTGEYVVTPENARGHSGGVVEVDGKVIGLLSRRKVDAPLCRAVAMHLLWPWIDGVIGASPVPSGIQPRVPTGAVSQAYRGLVEKVRARIRTTLEQPDVDALARHWGNDPLSTFDYSDPSGQLQTLLDGLLAATESSLAGWQRGANARIPRIKVHCLALLSELIKLAVDPDRGQADLGGVAAGTTEHIYLACQFSGTADIVYCALGDLPHLLQEHKKAKDVHSDKAVHLDCLLPSGEGKDRENELLRKLWGMVMREREADVPARIADTKYKGQLMSRIERHQAKGIHYFLSAEGPSDWCVQGQYRQWADALRVGLVLREEGQCTYLLMDEPELIDRVREYVRLLENDLTEVS